MMSGIV